MFDVAVIGAGPSGTAAAFALLKKGLKVLLLDKYAFPRKKACAGGITPKGYRLFPYDISSVVKQECRAVNIIDQNKKSFLIKDQNTICYMTKREDLDFFSLNKVMEKGAKFKVIKEIRSICETSRFVEINAGKDSFKASYLIGADGANSIVRRFFARRRFWKKQVAVEADVQVDRPDDSLMEFDFSKIRNGYFWIFPKSDHVNIGMYSIDSHTKFQARQLVEYAAQRFSTRRLEAVKGYPICTGGVCYRPDSNRVLLAGDAAGMAEPLFGEGIYFAVKSGQEAASAILESTDASAKELYLEKLKQIQSDLRLYQAGSSFFYRFPRVSLKLLSFPLIHQHFTTGYAAGRSLSEILSCRRMVKNF